jgi:hypothetical protein
MYEKRRQQRLEQKNEIAVSIVSSTDPSLKGKIIYHSTQDISGSGARILTHLFLPKDTLIKMQLWLTDPPRLVSALGRVKWARSLYGDESYEVGLEFVDTSEDAIHTLVEHINQVVRLKNEG